MSIRYIVRDRATKGCDFLMWGDDDLEAARFTLEDALSAGLDVELVEMTPETMDNHTRNLIFGY